MTTIDCSFSVSKLNLDTWEVLTVEQARVQRETSSNKSDKQPAASGQSLPTRETIASTRSILPCAFQLLSQTFEGLL